MALAKQQHFLNISPISQRCTLNSQNNLVAMQGKYYAHCTGKKEAANEEGVTVLPTTLIGFLL